MNCVQRLVKFFMLAGIFLVPLLSVTAQDSRPRLVNPKVDEVAGMIVVKPDPTNRGREVNPKRNVVLPKKIVKFHKTPVKTSSKAPTKSKKKEGNLKSMATKPAAKKPAAKKPAAKKPAAKKPAAKKPAAKKPAAKKPAAKKPAAKKPAAKKPAAKKPAAKKPAAKKPAAKKPAAKKPAAKKK